MSVPIFHHPSRFVLMMLAPLLLVLAATPSRSTRFDARDTPEAVTLTVLSIELDQFSGLTERRNYVITDASAWSTFWISAHAPLVRMPPLPAIDFTQEVVIAVSEGEQPTGAASIEIERVVAGADAITVYVHEITPSDDCWAVEVMTQPYHVIRLQRPATARIEFIARGTQGC